MILGIGGIGGRGGQADHEFNGGDGQDGASGDRGSDGSAGSAGGNVTPGSDGVVQITQRSSRVQRRYQTAGALPWRPASSTFMRST